MLLCSECGSHLGWRYDVLSQDRLRALQGASEVRWAWVAAPRAGDGEAASDSLQLELFYRPSGPGGAAQQAIIDRMRTLLSREFLAREMLFRALPADSHPDLPRIFYGFRTEAVI